MTSIAIPLVAAIIGAIIYLLTPPRFQQLGLVTFGCAMLVLLYFAAGYDLHVRVVR